MFKSMIDKVKVYYNAMILTDDMFDDPLALTKEEENQLVDRILTDSTNRALIEKLIAWKVGLSTKAAMRSPSSQETDKFKERAYGVGELTYDFKAIWERVHMRRQDREKSKEVKKEKFKFFGDNGQGEG